MVLMAPSVISAMTELLLSGANSNLAVRHVETQWEEG